MKRQPPSAKLQRSANLQAPLRHSYRTSAWSLRLGVSLVLGIWCLVLLPAIGASARDLKLITLDPGHFHAALFQREMLPGVAEKAWVYAPLGPDLTAHLNRVAQFNLRRDDPTRWQLDVRTGGDFFQRMLREKRGDIVIISGSNQPKIWRIGAIVRARMHVLADKPWIIEPEQFPQLQSALDTADRRRVIAYDAMTERFEISCLLQRELVNDPDIFGERLPGTLEEPAVYLRSLHHLFSAPAGVPNLRPVWFFDIRQQGEGLTDVGTHLVDRAQWTLFPEQAINFKNDIAVLHGTRWPLRLTRAQFQRVTGASEFPEFLGDAVKNDELEYFCNNSVSYTLRGIHVKLEVKWDFEAQPDAEEQPIAVFRGGRSHVAVKVEKSPEVYVIPAKPAELAIVREALRRKIVALGKSHPGLGLEERAGSLHVVIPDALRAPHEAHFAMVCGRFLEYVRQPKSLPGWEKPNMLAKYYVTTKGVELARQGGGDSANQ